VEPQARADQEHWLVDVAAREHDALERIHGWTAALAPHAASIDGEVGDENPRLALADARREVGDALVLSVGGSTTLPAASQPAAPPGEPQRGRIEESSIARNASESREFWHVWAVFTARVAKIPEPRSSAETREPPQEQGFFRWS
jgi:hypothetical protein